MTETIKSAPSLYMLLAVALGFYIGRTCRAQQSHSDYADLLAKLDVQRHVLNDAHKTIHRVSKGLEKASGKPQ